MARSIRLKFTVSGTDIDFYADEILNHKISNIKDFQLQENQTGSPYIYYVGNTNKVLEITFQEYYSTTRAKIDSLINAKVEMTIYYEYHYSKTNTLTMILYNKKDIRRTKIYRFGEKGANVIHRLTFLQSS